MGPRTSFKKLKFSYVSKRKENAWIHQLLMRRPPFYLKKSNYPGSSHNKSSSWLDKLIKVPESTNDLRNFFDVEASITRECSRNKISHEIINGTNMDDAQRKCPRNRRKRTAIINRRNIGDVRTSVRQPCLGNDSHDETNKDNATADRPRGDSFCKTKSKTNKNNAKRDCPINDVTMNCLRAGSSDENEDLDLDDDIISAALDSLRKESKVFGCNVKFEEAPICIESNILLDHTCAVPLPRCSTKKTKAKLRMIEDAKSRVLTRIHRIRICNYLGSGDRIFTRSQRSTCCIKKLSIDRKCSSEGRINLCHTKRSRGKNMKKKRTIPENASQEKVSQEDVQPLQEIIMVPEVIRMIYCRKFPPPKNSNREITSANRSLPVPPQVAPSQSTNKENVGKNQFLEFRSRLTGRTTIRDEIYHYEIEWVPKGQLRNEWLPCYKKLVHVKHIPVNDLNRSFRRRYGHLFT